MIELTKDEAITALIALRNVNPSEDDALAARIGALRLKLALELQKEPPKEKKEK